MAGVAGERSEDVLLERRNIIRRPRLTQILDKSTARGRMLVAPAGYGKTTLARQWLEDKRFAWYQGGPATMDVAALAAGLADVCSAIVPGAGERMRARLRVANSPEDDAEPLAELLAEDLADWPEEVWLAIDDYQYAMAAKASELFVDILFTTTSIPLLLMSRERPGWVTARRLLYGEVHELSRATLAMDQDEVEQMVSVSGADAVGLLALADGWPAVIGLAASLQRPVPERVPGALYEFFAEELLASLPKAVEDDLSQLALAPSLKRGIPNLLLGREADEALRRGELVGILRRDEDGSYAMHPLIRSFLLQRNTDQSSGLREAAQGLIGEYVRQGDWDAAFAVTEGVGDDALFLELFEKGFAVLLAKGRLATLNRWISHGEKKELKAPVLQLAQAEVAYRLGDARRARGIAAHSVAEPGNADGLAGRFLLLAGKAALLLHDTETARGYLRGAQLERLTQDEQYEAAWGGFLCAARLETEDADKRLIELSLLSQGVPDRQLRVLTGRWIVGVRLGTIAGLRDAFDSALPLVTRAADPTVRTAFLISRIHLLNLLAQYAEALGAIGELEAQARDFRLEFAVPHIAMAHALAHLGLRQFAQAAPLIAHAEEAGMRRNDVFIRMNSAALRARLLLYLGLASDAVAHLSEHWEVLPERSLHAEYLSLRALARTCTGDFEAAGQELSALEGITAGIEARVLGCCAKAVASARTRSNDADVVVGQALEASLETGNYDGLILACRLSPDLTEALARQPNCQTHLAAVIRSAGDHLLARQLGITLPPRVSADCLTPRESEVYELLALGRTNKEIAGALFISEPTAKVHTLHVLDKLSLRSRTEVALHAAEARGGYAADASSSES
jgi:LuxR family transcriptional regulator, maltose regulon positive regulatory protein